jgi:hypothetical protein
MGPAARRDYNWTEKKKNYNVPNKAAICGAMAAATVFAATKQQERFKRNY